MNFDLVEPSEFIPTRDKLKPYLKPFLTPYGESDYREQGIALYLNKEKNAGFGITPDGELVSVFSIKPQQGVEIVISAVLQGAQKLTCMGDKLRDLYEACGFKVKEKLIWDDTLAPQDWDYERFNTPDLYLMSIE